MKDLESLINRYIRVCLSGIIVRDREYALQHIKKAFKNKSKFQDAFISKYFPKQLGTTIGKMTLLEFRSLYHKYLVGVDIMVILKSNDFYHKLPAHEFPMLFEIENNNQSFDIEIDMEGQNKFVEFKMPKDKILIEENIPLVRNAFIRAFKRYFAFMELWRWIDTKGIEPIADVTVIEPIADVTVIEPIAGVTVIEPIADVTVVDETVGLLSIDKIVNLKNAFFSAIPISVVYGHFKVFTNVDKGATYLSEQELISFIQRAFLDDKEQPMQNINFKNGEKGFVIRRFYEFFVLATTKYGEINKKEKYIKLITDNFNNLNDVKSVTSFFRPNKTKKKW